MQIITSSPLLNDRVNQSITRILYNSSEDIKAHVNSLPLVLADDKKAEDIYKDDLGLFKKAYELGFGAMKGKVRYQGNIVHLVVLNFTLIDKLNLNDSEVDGVIAHELGHIFNDVPPRAMPHVLKGNHKDEVDAANFQLRKDREFFADYFAKRTKTVEGLISSIHKYINSTDCQNRDLFEERLAELQTDHEFQGRVLPLE